MDSIYNRAKTHFRNWREWEPNPVLLKELRQAMRSRVLTGALQMLLIALFVASIAIFVERSLLPDGNQQIGLPVFRAFLVILTAASLLFIPLYIGVRLAVERQDSDLDLMFITTLAPKRIIRGKLFSGAYLAVMFFSVCLPFMTFTNLLRGVDLPTIFLILVCLYGVVCLAIQVAILLACLPFHRYFKALIGALFAGGLLAVGAALTMFFFAVLKSGAAEMMGKPESWIGFIVSMVLILSGIQTFHSMAVALIMADNRPRGFFNEVIPEPGLNA